MGILDQSKIKYRKNQLFDNITFKVLDIDNSDITKAIKNRLDKWIGEKENTNEFLSYGYIISWVDIVEKTYLNIDGDIRFFVDFAYDIGYKKA